MHTRNIDQIIRAQVFWRTGENGKKRLIIEAHTDIFSVGYDEDGFMHFMSYDGSSDDNTAQFVCRLEEGNEEQSLVDYINKKPLLKIKVLLRFYEDQCTIGRAQSDDTRLAFSILKNTMEKLGFEWNTANAIAFGSKKYDQFRDEYFNEIMNAHRKITRIAA